MSRGGRPPIEPPMLPSNACWCLVRSEAVADSGAYNIIKWTRIPHLGIRSPCLEFGLGLGLVNPRAQASEF